MEILKTTGIVLSSIVYGEGDIIANIFTRDSGKRKFIFKGLKKSKTRSKSATEPGSLTNLVYYYRENREMHIVNEFSIKKYYTSILKNLSRIFHLYFILESVDKTSGYDTKETKVYELLLSAISALSNTENPLSLSSFFILHLLRIHGILPDLTNCKSCGGSSYNTFSLDISDLKPVCGSCQKSRRNSPGGDAFILDIDAKQFIDNSFKNKFNKINHEEYSEQSIKDLVFNLSLFIENYYHTEIKSKSFILSEKL